MIRSVLFWLHLATGVIASSIILVMSVTGVLLTFERQVTHWADLRQLSADNTPASCCLSADSLLRAAAAAEPGVTPASFTLRANPAEPAQISFGQAGSVFVGRASGAVLGSGSKATRDFFGSVEDWHRWLAAEGPSRKVFRGVTGAANLLFLVLIVSGMVLWLPKTWSWIKVRAVVWFRGGLSGKARDFNWHNVLGIWSALPLIAIVASGTVISYPWASDLVYNAVGETPPPRTPPGPPSAVAVASGRARPDAINASVRVSSAPVNTASGRSGSASALSASSAAATPTLNAMVLAGVGTMPQWKSVTVQLPKPDAKTVSVTVDRGTGGQPQLRNTIQFSRETGAVAKYQPFDSLSTGRRLRGVLRFTHTGEVLGLFGQTIAGLVSLASVVLVVTGISLAVRRASRALARRGAQGPETAADAVPDGVTR